MPSTFCRPFYIAKIAIINLLLIIYSNGQTAERDDIFTAIGDIEEALIGKMGNLSKIVAQNVGMDLARIGKLRIWIKKYGVKDDGKHQPKSNMADPISAFLFIKRLNRSWAHIKQIWNKNSQLSFDKLEKTRSLVRFPTEQDQENAAIGLLKLQKIYQLKSSDLADGIVDGIDVGRKLSAEDCYEIASAAYEHGDSLHAVEWLNEALKRGPSEKLEDAILRHFAKAHLKRGNRIMAVKVAESWIKRKHAGKHPAFKEHFIWFLKLLLMNRADSKISQKSIKKTSLKPSYEALCRGDFQLVTAAKIYCYSKRDSPYLRLSPLKVEILHFAPMIVIFRSVIADAEIAILKKLAAPTLRPSRTQNPITGKYVQTSIRTSKSVFLNIKNHSLIGQLERRIHDMINLNMATAEHLQVASYAIGGHYNPHYDFSKRNVSEPFGKNGNRIATVLFYLSQPLRGGLTVFTDLGIGIVPTIHDALFWYNLLPDGQGDKRTKHAACPVLIGHKWIANKWIRENGQEWARPCPLKLEVEEERAAR